MCPIQLIRDDEEHVIEVEGSKIYYRRIHGKAREAIIKRHEKRGRTNWTGALYEMIGRGITRWENVYFDGSCVEYSTEYVHRLPDPVIEELAEAIGANIERQAEEEENLSSTSGSNTPTTD